MAFNIAWDQTGEKLYETGVDRGVYYSVNETTGEYENGEAWNGITSVDENPSGGEPNDIYADNGKYLSLMSAEEFGATIGCYTYPDGFKKSNGEIKLAPGLYGGQQVRKPFGFSYRSLIGNDVKGEDYGYTIHLVYGCKASPSSASRSTTNENPEAQEFSYEINTTPVEVEGYKKMAHLKFETTDPDLTEAKITRLEKVLYGDGTTPGRLPLPAEVISIITQDDPPVNPSTV